MRILLSILGLFLWCQTTVLHAQSVNISGFIKSHAAFKQAGTFFQVPVNIRIDNVLYYDKEHMTTPQESGYFSLTIPLKKALPATLEYDGKECPLFLSPGDKLTINFNNDDFFRTITFSGQGAVNNNFFPEYVRLINPSIIEEELAMRKDYGQGAYNNYCEDVRQQEERVLKNYMANNQVSHSFRKWAETSFKYRDANRRSEYFFRSEDKQNDGYTSFASRYNINDSQALMSRDYMLFLDNHLRHLCMRDDPAKVAEREANRVPWVVRAAEIAQSKFYGKVKDYTMANLLVTLIDAEHHAAKNIYNDLTRTCSDSDVKREMGRRYNKVRALFSKEPPPGANLNVIPNGQQFYFKDLLSKYAGKVMYIDFWASWCMPCLAEMPNSRKLHEHFKGRNDIVFVYLSSDETDGPWRSNIIKYNLAGEHYLMSKELKLDAAFAVSGGALPQYVIVDKQGKIVNKSAKRPSDASLRYDLEALTRK